MRTAGTHIQMDGQLARVDRGPCVRHDFRLDLADDRLQLGQHLDLDYARSVVQRYDHDAGHYELTGALRGEVRRRVSG